LQGIHSAENIPSYLTTPQAADRVGVAVASLYRVIRQGLIEPPARFGSRFVWTEADVERFIRDRDRLFVGSGNGHRRAAGKGVGNG
jgi:predicted DNA-binding transcriptional regulator AlpA